MPEKYLRTTWAARLWRPKIRSDCGIRLPPSRRPQPQEAMLRRVYFSCRSPGVPLIDAAAVAGARRPAVDRATPERVLRVLFQGPTKAERQAGYDSTFGRRTANLPFTYTRHLTYQLAVVDLDRRFLDVPFAFDSIQEVAQIVSTAGQFPGVEWVAILIDGRPLCEAVDEC